MDPQSDDPQYLKNYIREHPNNKMAWYLLGRQYAAKGETGKANYCFAQAGEVYAAFEKGTAFEITESPFAVEEPAAETAVEAGRRKRSVWKSALAAALLLLGAIIPIQEEHLGDALARGTDPYANAAAGAAAPVYGASAWPEGEDDFAVAYAKPGSGEAGSDRSAQIGELLNVLRTDASQRRRTLLLADAAWSADRSWLLWPAPIRPIASAQPDDEPAGARLTYYDAQTCQCEPADAAAVLARYASWQSGQLERLIVRSAVAAYEAANGRPPATLDDLVQNYPNNTLPGVTPAMAAYWKQLTAEAQSVSPSGGAAGSTPESDPDSGASSLLSSDTVLGEPIRILIDKTTHRLAVVSGRTVLRIYPVGLGGDRTPEGEFVISEKVKNPNGRSNGTFGSRGMTLSDTLYAIHGTDRPSSIGRDQSLGCIRMLKPDVEELYDIVPKGTKVTIGSNLNFPEPVYRADVPLHLPSATDETNPNKVYKWLN